MSKTLAPTNNIITDQQMISSANRGPLTSLWVLPASCTATFSYTAGGGSPELLYFGHHGSVFDSNCYPTGANGALPAANIDWASYYYSPAICPSGWETATTFSSSFGIFPSPNFLSLGPETSAAICCPSGYSYYENGPQCYSPVTDEQLITYYSYSFDDNTWKKGRPTTLAWIGSTNVLGDGIPIFWKESDTAVLADASTIAMNPPATTASTPGPTSRDPSNPPTATDTPTPPPDGLPTGAKIGLGVGLPVAIIALLAITFLLWRRRRQHQAVCTNADVHDLGHQTEYKGAPTAPGYAARGYGAELHGNESQLQTQYYEIQTSTEGYHDRHELPSVAHR